MDERWTQLQTGLRDLASEFDRRGDREAADLASIVAARIDELFAVESARSISAPVKFLSSPPAPSAT